MRSDDQKRGPSLALEFRESPQWGNESYSFLWCDPHNRDLEKMRNEVGICTSSLISVASPPATIANVLAHYPLRPYRRIMPTSFQYSRYLWIVSLLTGPTLRKVGEHLLDASVLKTISPPDILSKSFIKKVASTFAGLLSFGFAVTASSHSPKGKRLFSPSFRPEARISRVSCHDCRIGFSRWYTSCSGSGLSSISNNTVAAMSTGSQDNV
jgi:hypothetical protein